jgi:hypothetical protein
MTNVFISHSPRDLRYLKAMQDRLLQWGYTPWIDPEPTPGLSWRPSIDKAILSADAMLVIMTPAAAGSVYVTYEWTLALGKEMRVITVIFKQATMHPRLTRLDTFDASSFKELPQFWEYFYRELTRILPPQQAKAAPNIAAAPAAPSQAAAPAASPGPPVDRRVMPAQPGHWVVMRRGPELNRMTHLHKPVLTIGRDDANDISIKDDEVSRYHMRLSKQSNGYYAVEDLNSTNGTFVNEARTQDIVSLTPGQTIRLGTTIILSYEYVPR